MIALNWRRCSLPLLFLLPWGLPAQTTDTISPAERPVDFITRETAGGRQFEPVLPPLLPRAGAPPSFWTYYWEFGDGTFDFSPTPVHAYGQPGEYEVIFAATGNYDTGKTPDKKRKKVADKGAYAAVGHALDYPDVIEEPFESVGIRAIRNPSPGEELILVLSYRNPQAAVQQGKLHLFFNEQSFRESHFQFLDSRTHYGEEEVDDGSLSFVPVGRVLPAYLYADAGPWQPDFRRPIPPPIQGEEQLLEARRNYRNQHTWRFNGLMPGETRNLFVSLEATPQMLVDTNVTIHLDVFLETDDGALFDRKTLDVEIVSAHDPNVMAVADRKIGFRNIRRNAIRYRTRFQNTGQGPAETIRITTRVPEALNLERLRVLDNYPACPICPKGEAVTWSCLDTAFRQGELIFTFRNVYLPGVRQDGVKDRDSTRGFVQYELLPGKKIRKLPFRSQAAIEFDKEPPVYTNWARTRFRYEPSPGLQTGYRFAPDSSGLGDYFFGLSLSNYKAYRWYLQPEIRTGLSGRVERRFVQPPDTVISTTQNGDLTIRNFTVRESSGIRTVNRTTVELVPLQLRRNLTGWLGAGVGAAMMVTLERQELQTTSRRALFRQVCVPDATGALVCRPDQPEPVGEPELREEQSERQLRYGSLNLFFDINLGLSRSGPAVGWRHHWLTGRQPGYRTEVYATWKF